MNNYNKFSLRKFISRKNTNSSNESIFNSNSDKSLLSDRIFADDDQSIDLQPRFARRQSSRSLARSEGSQSRSGSRSGGMRSRRSRSISRSDHTIGNASASQLGSQKSVTLSVGNSANSSTRILVECDWTSDLNTADGDKDHEKHSGIGAVGESDDRVDNDQSDNDCRDSAARVHGTMDDGQSVRSDNEKKDRSQEHMDPFNQAPESLASRKFDRKQAMLESMNASCRSHTSTSSSKASGSESTNKGPSKFENEAPPVRDTQENRWAQFDTEDNEAASWRASASAISKFAASYAEQHALIDQADGKVSRQGSAVARSEGMGTDFSVNDTTKSAVQSVSSGTRSSIKNSSQSTIISGLSQFSQRSLKSAIEAELDQTRRSHKSRSLSGASGYSISETRLGYRSMSLDMNAAESNKLSQSRHSINRLDADWENPDADGESHISYDLERGELLLAKLEQLSLESKSQARSQTQSNSHIHSLDSLDGTAASSSAIGNKMSCVEVRTRSDSAHENEKGARLASSELEGDQVDNEIAKQFSSGITTRREDMTALNQMSEITLFADGYAYGANADSPERRESLLLLDSRAQDTTPEPSKVLREFRDSRQPSHPSDDEDSYSARGSDHDAESVVISSSGDSDSTDIQNAINLLSQCRRFRKNQIGFSESTDSNNVQQNISSEDETLDNSEDVSRIPSQIDKPIQTSLHGEKDKDSVQDTEDIVQNGFSSFRSLGSRVNETNAFNAYADSDSDDVGLDVIIFRSGSDGLDDTGHESDDEASRSSEGATNPYETLGIIQGESDDNADMNMRFDSDFDSEQGGDSSCTTDRKLEGELEPGASKLRNILPSPTGDSGAHNEDKGVDTTESIQENLKLAPPGSKDMETINVDSERDLGERRDDNTELRGEKIGNINHRHEDENQNLHASNPIDPKSSILKKVEGEAAEGADNHKGISSNSNSQRNEYNAFVNEGLDDEADDFDFIWPTANNLDAGSSSSSNARSIDSQELSDNSCKSSEDYYAKSISAEPDTDNPTTQKQQPSSKNMITPYYYRDSVEKGLHELSEQTYDEQSDGMICDESDEPIDYQAMFEKNAILGQNIDDSLRFSLERKDHQMRLSTITEESMTSSHKDSLSGMSFSKRSESSLIESGRSLTMSSRDQGNESPMIWIPHNTSNVLLHQTFLRRKSYTNQVYEVSEENISDDEIENETQSIDYRVDKTDAKSSEDSIAFAHSATGKTNRIPGHLNNHQRRSSTKELIDDDDSGDGSFMPWPSVNLPILESDMEDFLPSDMCSSRAEESSSSHVSTASQRIDATEEGSCSSLRRERAEEPEDSEDGTSHDESSVSHVSKSINEIEISQTDRHVKVMDNATTSEVETKDKKPETRSNESSKNSNKERIDFTILPARHKDNEDLLRSSQASTNMSSRSFEISQDTNRLLGNDGKDETESISTPRRNNTFSKSRSSDRRGQICDRDVDNSVKARQDSIDTTPSKSDGGVSSYTLKAQDASAGKKSNDPHQRSGIENTHNNDDISGGSCKTSQSELSQHFMLSVDNGHENKSSKPIPRDQEHSGEKRSLRMSNLDYSAPPTQTHGEIKCVEDAISPSEYEVPRSKISDASHVSSHSSNGSDTSHVSSHSSNGSDSSIIPWSPISPQKEITDSGDENEKSLPINAPEAHLFEATEGSRNRVRRRGSLIPSFQPEIPITDVVTELSRRNLDKSGGNNDKNIKLSDPVGDHHDESNFSQKSEMKRSSRLLQDHDDNNKPKGNSDLESGLKLSSSNEKDSLVQNMVSLSIEQGTSIEHGTFTNNSLPHHSERSKCVKFTTAIMIIMTLMGLSTCVVILLSRGSSVPLLLSDEGLIPETPVGPGNNDQFGNKVWLNYASIIPNDFRDDLSGYAIAMSGDGSRLVVGGKDFSSSSLSKNGIVRIYNLSNGERKGSRIWRELTSIQGERSMDQFGMSVSLSVNGDHLVVGAPGYDIIEGSDSNEGKVYLFDISETNSTEWETEIESFIGSGNGEQLGFSLSIDSNGDNLAIGAPKRDNARGAVYVYTKDPRSRWYQIGNILTGENEYDQFGTSISLAFNGIHLIVGAPGDTKGYVKVIRILIPCPACIYYDF